MAKLLKNVTNKIDGSNKTIYLKKTQIACNRTTRPFQRATKKPAVPLALRQNVAAYGGALYEVSRRLSDQPHSLKDFRK